MPYFTLNHLPMSSSNTKESFIIEETEATLTVEKISSLSNLIQTILEKQLPCTSVPSSFSLSSNFHTNILILLQDVIGPIIEQGCDFKLDLDLQDSLNTLQSSMNLCLLTADSNLFIQPLPIVVPEPFLEAPSSTNLILGKRKVTALTSIAKRTLSESHIEPIPSSSLTLSNLPILEIKEATTYFTLEMRDISDISSYLNLWHEGIGIILENHLHYFKPNTSSASVTSSWNNTLKILLAFLQNQKFLTNLLPNVNERNILSNDHLLAINEVSLALQSAGFSETSIQETKSIDSKDTSSMSLNVEKKTQPLSTLDLIQIDENSCASSSSTSTTESLISSPKQSFKSPIFLLRKFNTPHTNGPFYKMSYQIKQNSKKSQLRYHIYKTLSILIKHAHALLCPTKKQAAFCQWPKILQKKHQYLSNEELVKTLYKGVVENSLYYQKYYNDALMIKRKINLNPLLDNLIQAIEAWAKNSDISLPNINTPTVLEEISLTIKNNLIHVLSEKSSNVKSQSTFIQSVIPLFSISSFKQPKKTNPLQQTFYYTLNYRLKTSIHSSFTTLFQAKKTIARSFEIIQQLCTLEHLQFASIHYLDPYTDQKKALSHEETFTILFEGMTDNLNFLSTYYPDVLKETKTHQSKHAIETSLKLISDQLKDKIPVKQSPSILKMLLQTYQDTSKQIIVKKQWAKNSDISLPNSNTPTVLEEIPLTITNNHTHVLSEKYSNVKSQPICIQSMIPLFAVSSLKQPKNNNPLQQTFYYTLSYRLKTSIYTSFTTLFQAKKTIARSFEIIQQLCTSEHLQFTSINYVDPYTDQKKALSHEETFTILFEGMTDNL
ncbi:hypothetical protein, partial [Candidatus Clavichlamydia salmonicola]|uniref:hypothetical protein n=1 Tax=Candidatus Clavichlamydia salmonicola TaxID=469812 RepID=UPI0018919C3A